MNSRSLYIIYILPEEWIRRTCLPQKCASYYYTSIVYVT